MPNILIADDHDLVRDTIAAYLLHSEGLAVTTASNLQAVMEDLASGRVIDLVILDYKMPGMDGLNGLARARAAFPDVKFALMSGVATAEVARAAMEMGASGFFPKSLGAETMVNAVRFVLAGERFFPVDDPAPHGNGPAYRGLTPREMQVLRGLCLGKSNKEIARELDLQEVTIKLHVKNLLQKLNVQNRTQAALRARDEGFA
ncbi:MAG: response regulator transcription factor [Pseudomonadota bacterium]